MKLNRGLITAIITTGLIAGFLDALAAVAVYMIRGGDNPIAIFNFIASGIFGKKAFTGGVIMAIAGLMFHLVIATIWSIIFFKAYSQFKWVSKSWKFSGLVYGIIVWVGMNLVVVPLSNAPKLTHTISSIVIGIVVLIFCIGLPIAALAHKHFSREQSTQ
jgi:hypothetical protein